MASPLPQQPISDLASALGVAGLSDALGAAAATPGQHDLGDDQTLTRKLSAAEERKVLAEARQRFKYVVDNDKDNRDNQREDTKFVYTPGAQWPQSIKDERLRLGNTDPCLEFNQLKQFVNQVVNDMRQKRPGVRVHPASGDASKKVADLLQGLIRNIEVESNAEAVYDSGYQHVVCGGRGFWRVVSTWESPESFNQKLLVKRVPDPTCVYPDIDYQEPDASDMNYCFVTEELTREEFEQRFPDEEPLSWDRSGDTSYWYDAEKVVLADYYRRVRKTRTRCIYRDQTTGQATTGWLDELPPDFPEIAILHKRDSEVTAVEWYQLGGGERVLKAYEWRGTIIPVVMDMGDEIMVDGRRDYQGLTRHARDAQALFNYGMTQQAIHLALAPRSPWVVAEGQTEGYDKIWQLANRVNFAYLPYKPTSFDDGTPVPPPMRQPLTSPDAGWASVTQMQVQMLRSTIGMYENSLGMRGQEVSGKAILAREEQGDNATFHYADNHARAIALTGRILVELIPHYYDTERVVQIIGEDGEPVQKTINERQVDPTSGALQAIKDSNVKQGKYAVVVDSGPTYKTKRQESADLLMQLVQAAPQVLGIAGDIVVKAQDLQEADQLAERFALTLPAPIQQAEAAKKAGQDPQLAQAQGQLQQMGQQLQQLQQALQQLQQENQGLKADKQASMLTAQAKLADARGKVLGQQGDLDVKHDANNIKLILGFLDYVAKTKATDASAQADRAALEAQRITSMNDQPTGVQ